MIYLFLHVCFFWLITITKVLFVVVFFLCFEEKRERERDIDSKKTDFFPWGPTLHFLIKTAVTLNKQPDVFSHFYEAHAQTLTFAFYLFIFVCA